MYKIASVTHDIRKEVKKMFKRKKQNHTGYMIGGAAGGFLAAAGLYALTNTKAIKKKAIDYKEESHDMTNAMMESGDDVLSGLKDVVEAAIPHSETKKEATKPELAKVIQKTLDHDPF